MPEVRESPLIGIAGLTLARQLQPVTKPIGIFPVRRPAAVVVSSGEVVIFVIRHSILCERYSIFHVLNIGWAGENSKVGEVLGVGMVRRSGKHLIIAKISAVPPRDQSHHLHKPLIS